MNGTIKRNKFRGLKKDALQRQTTLLIEYMTVSLTIIGNLTTSTDSYGPLVYVTLCRVSINEYILIMYAVFRRRLNV